MCPLLDGRTEAQSSSVCLSTHGSSGAKPGLELRSCDSHSGARDWFHAASHSSLLGRKPAPSFSFWVLLGNKGARVGKNCLSEQENKFCQV